MAKVITLMIQLITGQLPAQRVARLVVPRANGPISQTQLTAIAQHNGPAAALEAPLPDWDAD